VEHDVLPTRLTYSVMIGSSINLPLSLEQPTFGLHELPFRCAAILPKSFVDISLSDHRRIVVVDSVLVAAVC